ncbi:MAG: hypothetical protein K5829_10740 [Treponema sp.]|nr:hypothetical protein [Treponema sp.]
MKKLITTIVLGALVLAMSFAAPKNKSKKGGIKLDPKKNFAIEGVELGSLDWCKDDAVLTKKGELIWNQDKNDEWLNYGWELRGTDMSAYAGLRIEVSPAPFKNQDDLRVVIENPSSFGECAFSFANDGVCYVFFNGAGRWYGDMKNPDPEDGYAIRFIVNKNNQPKTLIKSIELLRKEDVPDASNLEILGVQFGSSCYQTRIIGNEITWIKGETGGDAGWNLSGIDLSEYDRVRVEIESSTAKYLGLRLVDPDHRNWHGFDFQVEPNVFDVDLSGEGASWVEENGTNFDKSKGLKIILQTWDRTKEEKTVVKSVQLLKGKRQTNENLILEGKLFGSSCWHAFVYEGGIIEWEASNDKCGLAGWNLRDVDLSKYKKIRIVLGDEAAKQSFDLKMTQDDCHLFFTSVKPTVLEANLDGSGNTGVWPNGAKWDTSKGINEIGVQINNLTKNQKTTVKSVTLLAEDDSLPQPEAIMLNGAKLGSKRTEAWIDENFAINWKKANWSECGWTFEKLEGDIVEVKVTSSDVPLRFRIWEAATDNQASYLDDGTHVFRINLKTKKQIDAKGGQKDPEWQKMTKAFDFSQGGKICLEPANGVYRTGKKTVVEYIKVE